MLCVLSRPMCLVPYMLSCLRCSHASLVIHALLPHVSGALRVFVLFVLHSLSALLLLIPLLFQMFQVKHAQMHLMYHNFYVLYLLCFWCLSYLKFLQPGLGLIIVMCHLKKIAVTMVFRISDINPQDLLTSHH